MARMHCSGAFCSGSSRSRAGSLPLPGIRLTRRRSAPLARAPGDKVTTSRGSRSERSSPRVLGAEPGLPAGTDRMMATIAGTDTSATDQTAESHPPGWPGRAPAGTPATRSVVVPSTDVARPRAFGETGAGRGRHGQRRETGVGECRDEPSGEQCAVAGGDRTDHVDEQEDQQGPATGAPQRGELLPLFWLSRQREDSDSLVVLPAVAGFRPAEVCRRRWCHPSEIYLHRR